jgi:putative endonuclease
MTHLAFWQYSEGMNGRVCAVYIMTNLTHTALYTGVTSDLPKRVAEHRAHADPTAFTARYNAVVLVWYDTTPSIRAAIAREKQLKAGSRGQKVRLIEAMNPDWRDLGDNIIC